MACTSATPDIRKRQPGERRRQGHAVASFEVVAVLHRSQEKLADELDRLLRDQIGKRVFPLVDRTLARRQRKSALSIAVNASMAWVSASMPLSAVTFGGQDSVSSGSTIAAAGRNEIAEAC